MPQAPRPRTQPEALSHARQLRGALTPAERLLWGYLRNRHIGGLKFRRQCPVGPFIVDFCCLEARLVVELDGETHDERGDYDATRSEWLERHGFRVLRFTNNELHSNLEGVVTTIASACGVDVGA